MTHLSEKKQIWIKVAEANGVAEGEILALQVCDEPIALYCVAKDEFYATHNICTHEVACLSDGWLDGYTVECPLHAGKFDVRTGEGQGAPVTVPVPTYPAKIVEGAVMLDVSSLYED